MTAGVDVIGDVHGQYDKLVTLLEHLGYAPQGGAWRHPRRTAVFVGDLIDRGPRQVATVALVRAMVETGSARCVLGNHEFNAISWCTPDPERPGHFVRDHHKTGNRKQHQAFLDEVEGLALHGEIVNWFKSLPLWLDLPGLRVVHACWNQASMDVLTSVLAPGARLTVPAVVRGNRPRDPVFEAIEVVCKGPEVRLPEGAGFQDKDGKLRRAVRVRWWLPEARRLRDAAIVPPGDEERIPDVELPDSWKGHPYAGPPVLFGHYWFTGEPDVISERFACLDWSVAKGGPLVAYRWDGETRLSRDKLTWVA
jgi:hypothetical protein